MTFIDIDLTFIVLKMVYTSYLNLAYYTTDLDTKKLNLSYLCNDSTKKVTINCIHLNKYFAVLPFFFGTILVVGKVQRKQ